VVIAKLRNVEKFIKRKITLHTLWRIMKTHALDLSVRVGCFWGVWEAKFALHLHKNVLENVQNMATLSLSLPQRASPPHTLKTTVKIGRNHKVLNSLQNF